MHLFSSPDLFFFILKKKKNTWRNEQAGKVLHIWIIHHRIGTRHSGHYRHEDFSSRCPEMMNTPQDCLCWCKWCFFWVTLLLVLVVVAPLGLSPVSPPPQQAVFSAAAVTALHVGQGTETNRLLDLLMLPVCLNLHSIIQSMQSILVLFTAVRRRSVVMIVAISGGLYYLWR